MLKDETYTLLNKLYKYKSQNDSDLRILEFFKGVIPDGDLEALDQLQKQLEVYEFILSQLNSATGEIVDRELIVNSVKTSSLYKPMGVIDIGL